MKNYVSNSCSGQKVWNFARRLSYLAGLGYGLLLCGLPLFAQSQQPSVIARAESNLPDSPAPTAATSSQQPEQHIPGTISGTIVDHSGTAVAGARIRLTRDDQSASRDVLSGDDGQFAFTNVAPGTFQLNISSTGFASLTTSGTLRSGENYVASKIELAVATSVTEVRVELSPIEIAQEQFKDEEKQRVLGVIPNFYVTYVPNAPPLTSKQKFNLAWKSSVDPTTFALTGAVAGIEQAQNRFPGYGQGAEGYGKRYGAAYADLVTSTFIGGAILPSVLKQDPRYFYKGTGSTRSRILYAVANSVICKGDNGRWQPNYSAILGSLAAGGISNLYYPEKDRQGASLTFENAAIGIGATAAANLIQEFILKKFTSNVPHSPNPNPATP